MLSKKYSDLLLIIFSSITFWFFAIQLIGFDEFIAFLDHTLSIVLSIDLIHGLKYPEPFFSIGADPVGARATRGLLLQLTAGLFVLNYLISNSKNKIFSSNKILFIFLYMLSLIAYKNALGRSDASHIIMSSDLPILINLFFILNYFLIFLEKKNFIKKLLSYKVSLSLSIIFLLFFYVANHNQYKVNNIKNFSKNLINYVNLNNDYFLDKKTLDLLK